MGQTRLFGPSVLGVIALIYVGFMGSDALGREPDSGFRVERMKDGIKATLRGVPFLEYHSSVSDSKPYAAKLYTPAGVQVLRDSPSDHVHHHALMFALGVNDVNFWHESPGAEGPPNIGRQLGGELKYRLKSNQESAHELVIEQVVAWLDGDNQAVAQEHRELIAGSNDAVTVSMLTWKSSLSAADGDDSISLNGERYFGLGMRFVHAMDEGGRFIVAEDRSADLTEDSENLIRASWCAYTARANGHPVTVAMFGHPENPRRETLWFTMVEPFAYLAATLGLQNSQLKLTSEEAIQLTYGIALSDGELGRDELQQLYQAWLQEDW